MAPPTAERVREILHYDAETGAFTWTVKAHCKVAGKPAGAKSRDRIVIQVDGKNYKAHRLAWLYVHGIWPEGVIDHLDGNAQNNRLANLRDTTQSVNMQNRHRPSRRSASQLLGAYRARKRFTSAIRVDGKVLPLGVFDTAEDAHQAYLVAKRRLHEGCTL